MTRSMRLRAIGTASGSSDPNAWRYGQSARRQDWPAPPPDARRIGGKHGERQQQLQRPGKARMFFSEEKKPKDFYFFTAPTIQAMAGIFPRGPDVKVFCFFLQKRRTCLPCLIAISPTSYCLCSCLKAARRLSAEGASTSVAGITASSARAARVRPSESSAAAA